MRVIHDVIQENRDLEKYRNIYPEKLCFFITLYHLLALRKIFFLHFDILIIIHKPNDANNSNINLRVH